MKKNAERKFYYGGQAVIEGVAMMGKTSEALSVRAPNGAVFTYTRRRAPRGSFFKKIPVIRGVFNFAASLSSGMRLLSKSAAVYAAEEGGDAGGAEKKGGGAATAVSLVLGLAFFIGLFIALPALIAGFVEERFSVRGAVWRNLIESGARLSLFVGYLFLISLMRDVRRTFMYHGAEHKVINCFERGGNLTPEGAARFSPRHNRCGTTFLFFVVAVGIIVFSFVTYLTDARGITRESLGGALFTVVRVGIRIALLPLIAGLSYELLRLLARGSERNIALRILRAPGLALQRLTVREPDAEMLSVALSALAAARAMDADASSPGHDFTASLRDYREIKLKKAEEAGIEGAAVDFILCEVLNCGRGALSAAADIALPQAARADALYSRLLGGEPLQYIIGYTDFAGVRIITREGAFIPRQDTEVLAEAAAEYVAAERAASGGKLPRILDLCCGSGCIGLAVAARTGAECDFCDISEVAAELTRENVRALGARGRVFVCDLDEIPADVSGGYGVITCNPPYIRSGDIPNLPPEVRREPSLALDGGADGLDFYRRLADALPRLAGAGGRIFLEIGDGQCGAARDILSAAGFTTERVIKDFDGAERVLRVKRN